MTSNIEDGSKKTGQSLQTRGEWRRHWTLVVILGALLACLGCTGIALSFASISSPILAVGWFLLASGLFQGLHAFSAYPHRSFPVDLVTSSLFVVVGLVLIADYLASERELAMVLGSGFMVLGVIQSIIAMMHPFAGRISVFACGLITFYFGLHLWLIWLNVGFRLICLFVGIEIAITGWSLIMRGLGEKRLSLGPAEPLPEEGYP